MKKQILVLSVVLAASAGMPAFAQQDPLDDITTEITTPIATATANPDGSLTPADIKLDTGGAITISGGTTPAVTINSDNSFAQVEGTTLSFKNTNGAVGILTDLTTQSINATNAAGCAVTNTCAHVVEGILEQGTIDLSGTGTNKRGLWFEGPTTDDGSIPPPNTYTGNVDLGDGTITITGDGGIGVLVDSSVIMDGNITFGTLSMQTTSLTGTSTGVIGFENNGVINGDVRVGFVDSVNDIDQIGAISVTGSTSSTATGVIGLDLGGTINGNVVIDTGSSVLAAGTGAQGVLITGSINPCSQSVDPGCTDLGSFINRGAIRTVGTNSPGSNATGNPVSGSALAIGGSVIGGIYNAGPTSSTDGTAGASIVGQSFAPVFEISPSLQAALTPTAAVIGVYTGDLVDPGFSVYNRGSIIASPSNYNQSSEALDIVGDGPSATATLTGGLFNSGTISATANTTSSSTAESSNAITIGANAIVGKNDTYSYSSGCDCMKYSGSFGLKLPTDLAALVNSNAANGGTISAITTGPTNGNSAIAIDISVGATLPSIINSGLIEAVASSSDTTIASLFATAIEDSSGTLAYIQNNGTIEALATQLDNKLQSAVAINLTLSTSPAVEILNQAQDGKSATILGDIDFGQGGHQIVNVLGFSSESTAQIIGDIKFGGGGDYGTDELNIGSYATVTGAITADSSVGATVDVKNLGVLTITNDTEALNAAGFHIETGGTLNITVLSNFNTGVVDASFNPSGSVVFDTDANLHITYGSWIPANAEFVLFKAPLDPNNPTAGLNIPQSDMIAFNAQLKEQLPFLFSSAILQIDPSADQRSQQLDLYVVLKDPSQLGLTGYAAQMVPYANQALVNDNPLGAAFVNGITDQQTAQRAYGEMAPDVTGGVRAIAMSLTDQGTGPVAARQRMLRMYGKDSGDVTLWGQEFAEFSSDPGDPSAGKSGFKDHGFGFVLGIDGGDPKAGWYGGAFSFYSGDVVEALPRDSHSNTLWYMLTGYTDWRGKGLFLDTKVDVAYMTVEQKRFLSLTIPPATAGGDPSAFLDEADSRRPGLTGSAGFTTGVILAYGATTFTPQLSVDGMTMREEGYTESHPTASPGNGKGFDLSVSSYYANSLRVFLGADVRHDLDFGDFFIQPDVRAGYRYDFINDPTNVKAHFANISPDASGTIPGPNFNIEGPDPSQGNFVVGGSLSATTDSWTIGLNYDFVRGTNGATTQVGTVHLLGRI